MTELLLGNLLFYEDVNGDWGLITVKEFLKGTLRPCRNGLDMNGINSLMLVLRISGN
jgi:hypothetical protein